MKKIKTTETGREKNMLSAIKDITKADSETYWILWRYAPDLLTEKIETFEELKSKYAVFADKTEEACNKYIYKEEIHYAILGGEFHAKQQSIYAGFMENGTKPCRKTAAAIAAAKFIYS